MFKDMYTVIRTIEDRKIPLRTFTDLREAIEWTKLQMTWLNREYDYYIAVWNLNKSVKIEVEDKRVKLKLIK